MLSMAEHGTEDARDTVHNFDPLTEVESGYDVRIQKITSSTDNNVVVHHEAVSKKMVQSAPSAEQYAEESNYSLQNDLTATITTEHTNTKKPNLAARLSARQDLLQISLLLGVVLLAICGFIVILYMINNSADYWIEDQQANVIVPAAGGYETLYPPEQLLTPASTASPTPHRRMEITTPETHPLSPNQRPVPAPKMHDASELLHILTETE